MTRGFRQHGFSLIEALAGLFLIGVVLLLTMALMAQQPRVERRLAAHQEALRTLELVLEQTRASGVLPKESEVGLSTLGVSPELDLSIRADVSSLLGPNLYEVVLTAKYFVEEREFELMLETMMFTP